MSRISPDVIAVHLGNLEGDAAENEASEMRRQWAEKVEAPAHRAGVSPPKLEQLRTPFREFVAPLLKQVDSLKSRFPNRMVAVIIPEIVEEHWWHALLHSRRAARLRSALRSRLDDRVIVVELPWFIKPGPDEKSGEKK